MANSSVGNGGRFWGPALIGAGATVVALIAKKAAVQAPTMLAGDWVEGLTAEHAMVRELISKLEDTADDQVPLRRKLTHQLKVALTKHVLQEENAIYPAIEEAGDPVAVESLVQDHADMKRHLYRLAKLDAASPDFLAEIAELREELLSHMAEEEDVLFPRLRAQMDQKANRELALLMHREGLSFA